MRYQSISRIELSEIYILNCIEDTILLATFFNSEFLKIFFSESKNNLNLDKRIKKNLELFANNPNVYDKSVNNE